MPKVKLLIFPQISLGALIVMVPANPITQEALQHFEVAYRYMAGTLAQESEVRALDLLFKAAFLIDPT